MYQMRPEEIGGIGIVSPKRLPREARENTDETKKGTGCGVDPGLVLSEECRPCYEQKRIEQQEIVEREAFVLLTVYRELLQRGVQGCCLLASLHTFCWFAFLGHLAHSFVLRHM